VNRAEISQTESVPAASQGDLLECILKLPAPPRFHCHCDPCGTRTLKRASTANHGVFSLERFTHNESRINIEVAVNRLPNGTTTKALVVREAELERQVAELKTQVAALEAKLPRNFLIARCRCRRSSA